MRNVCQTGIVLHYNAMHACMHAPLLFCPAFINFVPTGGTRPNYLEFLQVRIKE